jgi:hypothetical protein
VLLSQGLKISFKGFNMPSEASLFRLTLDKRIYLVQSGKPPALFSQGVCRTDPPCLGICLFPGEGQRLGRNPETGQSGGFPNPRRMPHLACAGITIYLENDGHGSSMPSRWPDNRTMNLREQPSFITGQRTRLLVNWAGGWK